MGAALIITLRETLEASLVVGILLAFLKKTGNQKHSKYVWSGVGGAVVVSVLLAVLLDGFLGGFQGAAEEVYEGVMMLVAAGLLTWMILWMMQQRSQMRAAIESKAEVHIKEDHPMGIFFLSFVSVLREGIETVIFLNSAVLLVQSDGDGGVLVGGVLGILIALLLAVALFRGFAKVPLRNFFAVTGVVLLFFAAGLLAHGVHEFQEAGFLPIIKEHLWDTNMILDEDGVVGGLMKGLFGYNGNPSLLEVVIYWLYLAVMAILWKRLEKMKR